MYPKHAQIPHRAPTPHSSNTEDIARTKRDTKINEFRETSREFVEKNYLFFCSRRLGQTGTGATNPPPPVYGCVESLHGLGHVLGTRPRRSIATPSRAARRNW